MPRIWVSCCAILLAVNAIELHAALVFQPSGVSPGDQYRLVFLSSTTRDATLPTIGVYNQFVQDLADAAPVVSTWGLTWRAMASTPTVHAINNTTTFGTGVPIYRVDGHKVANNYTDLWDGNLDIGIGITELGTAPSSGPVWTGSDADGTGAFGLELGHADGNAVYGTWQDSLSSEWMREQFVSKPTSESHTFYAISNVVTAIPEINAFVQLSLLGIVAAVFIKLRKRLSC
ncbi:MAG: hypothetical protein KDB27_13495 [Planctomycetales bacterium]|nr:hypothetical protein [Planctomycetales bacterium]